MLVANLPAIHEQREVFGAWWNASHHSQNFHDVRQKVAETWVSSSFLNKVLTVPFGVGLAGAEAYELSHKNENRLADIALERFVASGGQDIFSPARGVAAFTGLLELGIGVGAVIALHKYRAAMDVIRQRYFAAYEAPEPESTEPVVERAKRMKLLGIPARAIAKAGKIWGLAIPTGAFGVTTLEDASRKEYSPTKNAFTAVAAAGALAVNNAAIAAGVFWGVKTETPYVSDGLMNFAELVKTPIFVASLIGGGMAFKGYKEQRRIKKKWAREAEAAEQSSDTHLAVQVIQ